MHKAFGILFCAAILFTFRHITMAPETWYLGMCIMAAGFMAGGDFK